MRRIQTLPRFLRPREKILKRGAKALTTAELLAVVFVTGTKNHPVLDLSNKIARHLDRNKPTAELAHKLNLGPSKRAQLLAVVELAARLNNTTPVRLTSPQDIFAHSYDILREKKEILLCFYLNARDELLKKEAVAVGSLNRANLLPRELFSLIQDLPVASIILVHNHPSGILEPSDADILFTKRVEEAGKILGVKLLDHLIVSEKGWVRISF